MSDELKTFMQYNIDLFTSMAERIRHNVDSKFGGAALIIPPAVTGKEKPIELLMLGEGDPAQFIATLITRLQMMAREIDEQQRSAHVFGIR